ncbi:MAG TPA: S-adenosylmethionine decarboxylase proenzyme [Dehalococcoidia bacterium]|nr:S-adenosylmethionine decarboxylase proenzyme [Dehalococcoidia bacterium]
MNALGKHLLLELKDCDRELLNDIGFLKKALLSAAVEAGATVLGESFHQFSPQGVSGVVVVSESHLCIHTWPEHGYAAADIFTCGDSVQPEKAAEFLVRELSARSHSAVTMRRGVLDAEGSLG